MDHCDTLKPQSHCSHLFLHIFCPVGNMSLYLVRLYLYATRREPILFMKELTSFKKLKYETAVAMVTHGTSILCKTNPINSCVPLYKLNERGNSGSQITIDHQIQGRNGQGERKRHTKRILLKLSVIVHTADFVPKAKNSHRELGDGANTNTHIRNVIWLSACSVSSNH